VGEVVAGQAVQRVGAKQPAPPGDAVPSLISAEIAEVEAAVEGEALIDFECGPNGGADDFLEWFFKADRGELELRLPARLLRRP
jgi:hypothetical protein